MMDQPTEWKWNVLRENGKDQRQNLNFAIQHYYQMEIARHDGLPKTNIYGDSIEIRKEECINHVAKRMGTALTKVIDFSV